MSHIATIDVEVSDLNALHLACRRLGLYLDVNASTYRWFGERVGDEPLPEGITVEQLGKCHSKITIPGDDTCYEVGVVCVQPGRPGIRSTYRLLWDFWGPEGRKMQEKIGERGQKLKHAYAVEAAKIVARINGHSIKETQRADGSTQLEFTKRGR